MKEFRYFFEIKFEIQQGNFLRKIDIKSDKKLIGLKGPSGCGKTSLLKILAGLDSLSQGFFFFNNTLFHHTHQKIFIKPWQRNFAYLPQNVVLLPHLTVKQNILFPQKAIWNSAVIERLGLDSLLDRMPRHLSGGEKQRVGLARVLLQHGILLLLDEPFSALDENNKAVAIELLKDSHLPAIIISHGTLDLEQLNCQIEVVG